MKVDGCAKVVPGEGKQNWLQQNELFGRLHSKSEKGRKNKIVSKWIIANMGKG